MPVDPFTTAVLSDSLRPLKIHQRLQMGKSLRDSGISRQLSIPRVRRTHAERRETTRRQLLDAAIGCLHERGFAGATLEIIADRAGVSRGAVQFHFGNRDDLYLGIIEEIRVRLSKLPTFETQKATSLDDQLVLICDHYWKILSSPDYIAAVQVHIGTMHDFKPLSADVTRTQKCPVNFG